MLNRSSKCECTHLSVWISVMPFIICTIERLNCMLFIWNCHWAFDEGYHQISPKSVQKVDALIIPVCHILAFFAMVHTKCHVIKSLYFTVKFTTKIDLNWLSDLCWLRLSYPFNRNNNNTQKTHITWWSRSEFNTKDNDCLTQCDAWFDYSHSTKSKCSSSSRLHTFCRFFLSLLRLRLKHNQNKTNL